MELTGKSQYPTIASMVLSNEFNSSRARSSSSPTGASTYISSSRVSSRWNRSELAFGKFCIRARLRSSSPRTKTLRV